MTIPDERNTRRGSRSSTNGEGSRDRASHLQDLISSARSELETLTGRPVDSVSALRRTDAGWRLTVDVVELERIPASTSVLGSYEVLMDGDGSVVEYERVGRYYRNQASEADYP